MLPNNIKTFSLLCAVLIAASLQMKAQAKPCGSYDTQSEMNQCAATEAKKADALLNATYQELLAKLKDDKIAQAKLIAAQRAWIAFRDAELAAMWPTAAGEDPRIRYGSVHPFCYSEELATMTHNRTRELRELMSHQEGDVCGGPLAKCTAQPPGKIHSGQ
jgi:uncharacterized protein YecT (DUF1311 family)